MTRYDFVQVSLLDNNRVRVSCTDSAEIENLILLLKPLNPGLKVEVRQTQVKETWDWQLSGFSSVESQGILWWLIKQLGLHGWEPLGGVYLAKGDTTRYQFRRKMK